ncbi:MAG: GNAT family N-acetyltransferase [Chitinophagaceae bacterium]|nr:GNAT family N-acetyltransferase [Chitinophagaceae bacterium]
MNPIETPRLLLIPINESIYHEVMKTKTDEEIMHFFGHQSQADLDKEKLRFTGGMTTFNISYIWFLIHHKADHKVIGSCSFHKWYTDHNRAEIGYAIYRDEYKQLGIMSETIREVLIYGFEQMNLHRVEAMIGSGNQASLSLIRNMGFTWEGLLRDHFLKNGNYEDSNVFSLLKTEFEAHPSFQNR